MHARCPPPPDQPLRAVHTPNFPALLRRFGASLLVTTYQAGKLVRVRDEGDHLNTHFRAFQAPMGMALDGDRLAIGTKNQVWECVNVLAVAARLDPPGRHDAWFLPRSSHVTGNIQIHEMAWGAGGELWVVNTRFSCLCKLDRSVSFAPWWRSSFVSALQPTDRYHLNNLGMVAGKPKYIAALGETDIMAGSAARLKGTANEFLWKLVFPRSDQGTNSVAKVAPVSAASDATRRPHRSGPPRVPGRF